MRSLGCNQGSESRGSQIPFAKILYSGGSLWNLFKGTIIYLSFLNCIWLLIREVQRFYWTQELLVPVEKFTGIPGGYFHIGRSGGLDLTSSLETKFGARLSQVQEKLGKFCCHKTQKLGKNPNFGVITEIQRAKSRILVTYIFEDKIWGSDMNFRGKFWGQPPDLLI